MYYITYENILSNLVKLSLHFLGLISVGVRQVVHKPSGYWGEKLKVKGESKPSKGGADPICIVAHTFMWTLINMKWPVHMRYSFRINVLCCHCLTLLHIKWFQLVLHGELYKDCKFGKKESTAIVQITIHHSFRRQLDCRTYSSRLCSFPVEIHK